MSSTPVFAYPKLNDGQRWRGKRVGLFGGSFNPPHAGHLHIARMAQVQFGLDFVWWIVTPQNPLKSQADLAAYNKRFGAVEDMLANHPRQLPTHIESHIKTQYTFDTVCALRENFSQTDFLWICGMDNAHIFHKWDRWRELLEVIPITFIARPPAQGLVRQCPVRQMSHIPQYSAAKGRQTDLKSRGIYWIQGIKMLDISSTQIRKNQQKQ